ncbi:MAG: hypothetical protein H6550_13950 [Chitinophagales bacterium]|nr:hypothetical protein [Chitinophagales bacterium]
MNKLLYLVCCLVLFTSCGNETYTCSCKHADGKEIAGYKIEAAKKSTASFECKQKGLKFSGAEYKDVKCELE